MAYSEAGKAVSQTDTEFGMIFKMYKQIFFRR